MCFKKIIAFCILLVSYTPCSFAINPVINKFFIGLDFEYMDIRSPYRYKHSKINGERQKKRYPGASLNLGYRFDQLSSQIGYTRYETVRYRKYSSPTASLRATFSDTYFDLLYHIPVLRKLELKALVGAGVFTESYRGTAFVTNDAGTRRYAKTSTKRTLVSRLGLGLEYRASSDASLTIMYKNQSWQINSIALGLLFYL